MVVVMLVVVAEAVGCGADLLVRLVLPTAAVFAQVSPVRVH